MWKAAQNPKIAKIAINKTNTANVINEIRLVKIGVDKFNETINIPAAILRIFTLKLDNPGPLIKKADALFKMSIEENAVITKSNILVIIFLI